MLEALGTTATGLSEREAADRLAARGPNELPRVARTGAARIVLRQFQSPLIYILLVAAAVSLAVGEGADAVVIAVVLVLNAAVGFVQEYRAERSLEALRELTTATADRVLRDGVERQLDAARIVIGDVLHLDAGARVPADTRILESSELETDESLLTGESAAVAKDDARLHGEVELVERHNMLWAGSVIVRGRARVVVTATGERTELGAIAGSMRRIGRHLTPLQERMGRFARLIGAAVLLLGVVGFTVGAARGEPPEELFLAVVALAVSAIPEGLPVVLTVALAISVRRMATARAIVRRLPAVESLGSCTVIGADKTGTLTENRMTVERVVTEPGVAFTLATSAAPSGGWLDGDGDSVELEGEPDLRQVLIAGSLCNEAQPGNGVDAAATGDPTEVALLVAASRAGVEPGELRRSRPRLAAVPFDPGRRYAASLHADSAGGRWACVVGSPEQVLAMSGRSSAGPLQREGLLEEAELMAAQGLRVLAMAGRSAPAGSEELPPLEQLTFYGLQGMMDPLREGAVDTVSGCRRAGIRVIMITGDHASTAVAIARQLGIAEPTERAVSGPELARLDSSELARTLDEHSVYARVVPAQKLRLVEALRDRGEIVAVTGDGVNDAPALKAADIGAAMGSGTDVAKEAADIVVLDDNLATIFAAVGEGRVAFDNVRKATFFLVSSGFAEVLAVLVSIAAGIPLPFLPAQLLWLNFVTNGVQDVALVLEPGGPDVADRPPRPPREGVLSRLLWERIAISGVVMAAGTLALFLAHPHTGDDLERARTIALTTMVVFQAVHVGNARSEHRSLFARSPLANPFLLVGTALAIGLHIGALHFGPTQELLSLQPLDLATWVGIVAVALSVAVAVELHKLFRRPSDSGSRATTT